MYESYPHELMPLLRTLYFWFSTIGIVKMAYYLIGSLIETSLSCHAYGKCLKN